MHFSLGNTQRGILAGYVTSLILALASALHDSTDWKQTLAGVLLITGPVAGALIDPGSAPPKA